LLLVGDFMKCLYIFLYVLIVDISIVGFFVWYLATNPILNSCGSYIGNPLLEELQNALVHLMFKLIIKGRHFKESIFSQTSMPSKGPQVRSIIPSKSYLIKKSLKHVHQISPFPNKQMLKALIRLAKFKYGRSVINPYWLNQFLK
jgi:hypothetical protein